MLVVCVVLLIQSYWDLRYKEIPIIVTVCGSVLGVLYSVLMKRAPMEVIMALSVGMVLLLIGRITQEAVGYGDGLLVGMMGLYYSLMRVWTICICAFFLAGIVSMILLVIFRKKGNYQVPFVPFLLVANLLCFIETGGN